MTFDLWDHQFCLACDKQVQADGDAYCSESCRLADFEKTSSSSSTSPACSPGFSAPSYPWTIGSNTRPTPTKFYLSPAYDFSNAQPYGTTPVQQPSFHNNSIARASKPGFSTPQTNLTPSSSHSSLSSMQSSSSTEAGQLSDKARQELQAYAVSFEQVRMQRRRSY